MYAGIFSSLDFPTREVVTDDAECLCWIGRVSADVTDDVVSCVVAGSEVGSGAGDPVMASSSLPVLNSDRLLPDERLGLPLVELDPSVGASSCRGPGFRTPETDKPSPAELAVVVLSPSAGGATCFRCCCCPLLNGRRTMTSPRADAHRGCDSANLGVLGGLTLDDSVRLGVVTTVRDG